MASASENTAEPAAAVPIADSAPAAPPQFTYAPSAPVSRRQFRFLLTITMLNTLMLGGFVAGPAISRITSGWWQDYQRWQADRKAAAKRLADQQTFEANYRRCLDYTRPAGEVVYDEDPTRAAQLQSAGTDYARVHVDDYQFLTPQPWQPPVLRKTGGAPATMFPTSRDTPVFVHARRSAGGPERLVWVDLRAQAAMRRGPGSVTPTEARTCVIVNQRLFTASAYLARPDGRLDDPTPRTLAISQTDDHRSTVTWTKAQSWENGHIDTHLRGVFRVFAGQADPADVSHFTIGYELDGVPGLIDGWLTDDGTVLLQPRAGRIVRQDAAGHNREWDPYAEPAPATRPSAPRL